MGARRTLMLVIGIVAVLFGLLFAGQGAGLIMWPASSFMLAKTEWVVRGALVALVGAVAIWWSRRL